MRNAKEEFLEEIKDKKLICAKIILDDDDGKNQKTSGNMVKKKAAKTRKAASDAAKGMSRAVENAVTNATSFTRSKRPRSTTKTSASSKNGSPKRQRSSPTSVTMEEESVVPI